MQIVTRQEAEKQGFKRFFTGRPCKRGHITERLVSTRTCLDCKLMHKMRWQADNSEKHKAYNVGKSAEWRANNRERHRSKSREIYWRDPERARERERNRWKNDEQSRQRHKTRLKTPEYKAKAVKQAKKWAKQNPEKMTAAIRSWMKRHPEKCALYQRNRRARVAAVGGSHTLQDVKDILRLQGGKCAYCRTNLKKYHVDHITPIKLGGSNDRSNLQLLCAPCNFSKHARDPIVFAQSLGRLL